MTKASERLSANKTNIEIKPKLKIQKSPEEQLAIMEEYTRVHAANAGQDKAKREVECLKVLLPRLFRTIEPADLIAGRMDYLPIGFGCVTSVGGVGHYLHQYNMFKFMDTLEDEGLKARAQALVDYWDDKDTRTLYMNQYTDGKVLTVFGGNPFLEAAASATARLSGMMLNYNELCDLGIDGLKEKIKANQKPGNAFQEACLEALDLFDTCCTCLADQARKDMEGASEERKQELALMAESLDHVAHKKPETFHQALQLVWLYALMAGVINYGRLDDVLGSYLKKDLAEGTLTHDQAKAMVKSLWTMIENKRTTVNGRVIVGGRGRRDPEGADMFTRICMEVCKECRYVEPQFTLRIYEDTPEDIKAMALECLADGATYPTLYYDNVNVPALSYCMRIPAKEAEQYAPFGCGEMNIVGKTVSPPNTILNLTKFVNIILNEGIDPFDGVRRNGPVPMKRLEDIQTFEEFYDIYQQLNDYYAQMCVDAQIQSYDLMNSQVSFLYNSILMDGCIEKGKALLDGGAQYMGGSCETFGNVNASDALTAIKKLVFDEKKYTLRQINDALLADFEGYEKLRQDLWKAPKYGNDNEEADAMSQRVYESIAKPIRDFGIASGLQYYGIVIINNNTNTFWGNKTSASADGRHSGVYLNPSNNPQGGADVSGPTSMLNSLLSIDPKYHVGSVQNIKFQKNFFKENLDKISMLFDAYFKKGGCQLMVTVVDSGALEDAMIHPEDHKDLIVRVSGFSAVFVELDREVQTELLSRTLYEGA